PDRADLSAEQLAICSGVGDRGVERLAGSSKSSGARLEATAELRRTGRLRCRATREVLGVERRGLAQLATCSGPSGSHSPSIPGSPRVAWVVLAGNLERRGSGRSAIG